jgi:hypothetical protein
MFRSQFATLSASRASFGCPTTSLISSDRAIALSPIDSSDVHSNWMLLRKASASCSPAGVPPFGLR